MSESGRPNILVICSDQQHWAKCGFNGHPLVRTPHLDALAASGANFRACYSNSPVCAPARASFFTGRLPSDVGAYDNAAPFDGRVPTFGNVARDQGYHCFATGKLDFWAGRDYGFIEDETAHGHEVNPDITALFRNPMCYRPGYGGAARFTPREGESKDMRFARRGARFLAEEAPGLDRPWLCWVGFNQPHPPFRAPVKLFESYPLDRIDVPRFPAGWRDREHPVTLMTRFHREQLALADETKLRQARAGYYAMITEVDAMVGLLLDALDATGQRENTIIVFTADHGEMLGEHGFWLKNAPYDDCARVPLVMAGPGVPAGKVVETPVSLMDIYSTIVNLVGGPALDGVRGASLLPLLNGGTDHPPVLVEHNTERLITGIFTIREGDWKYNYYAGYPDELFNLKDDPGEWVNLAGDPDHAETRARLRAALFARLAPDRINDEAFADQKRRLDAIMAGKSPDEMVAVLRSRLGEEQSRDIVRRYIGET